MDQQQFDKLIKRIEELKIKDGFDLSTEEDLSIAIMNLISLEEHFFFTGAKVGKEDYFKLLDKTRAIRKNLLARMIDTHEGETWCISKHLLAATMRLIEVGTKLYADGKTDQAKDTFTQAYQVYSLFWSVRLKLLNLSQVKAIGQDKLNRHDKNGTLKGWTVEDIVNKLVDCCDE